MKQYSQITPTVTTNSLLPYLFTALQIYDPFCDAVIDEIIQLAFESRSRPSLVHVKVGSGCPLAEQVKLTDSPSFTTLELIFADMSLGASVQKANQYRLANSVHTGTPCVDCLLKWNRQNRTSIGFQIHPYIYKCSKVKIANHIYYNAGVTLYQFRFSEMS